MKLYRDLEIATRLLLEESGDPAAGMFFHPADAQDRPALAGDGFRHAAQAAGVFDTVRHAAQHNPVYGLLGDSAPGPH